MTRLLQQFSIHRTAKRFGMRAILTEGGIMLYSRPIGARRTSLKQTVSAIAFVVFAWLAAASLQAHHSPSAIFDMTKHVAITGTLTRVNWINPHIVLEMEAKGEGGKVEQWTFQSNPPSWYKSVGLARADFAKAIGQTITVEAVKARDGSLYGYMDKIRLPDGTSYELVNNAEPK
jgi:hypothetical protein